MTVLAAILLFVVLFMVFISMVLLVIGPVMLLQPHRRTIEYYRRLTTVLHPSDLGLAHEELTITSAEGIPLHCWFIPAGGTPRGTVIFLHGVSECVIVGLPVARRLHDAGFNVFLYDSRRHGDSGGRFCTYGFYEKHDTSTVISYLEDRKDIQIGKIGLMGSSMGAAVAIQVAALDPRVSSVLAESGFATLRTVYDEYQKRIVKVPWHYLRNIVIKRSEHIAHFKASAVSPLEAVRNVRVPILFMHGTTDNLIRHTYTERVYANANEPKELWLIQGARHNNMAEVGGEEYFRRIVEFFERTLKK
ncbi:MAG: alpha/beta fold hydrolase [Ignavibacteriae bacterium]|nr:alpha/beta fold hydrolase [Ignavibacteriota bacterium]